MLKFASEIEELELEMEFGHFWELFNYNEISRRKFVLLHHSLGDNYLFGKAFVFLRTKYSNRPIYHYCAIKETNRRVFWEIPLIKMEDLKIEGNTWYPYVNGSENVLEWKEYNA